MWFEKQGGSKCYLSSTYPCLSEWHFHILTWSNYFPTEYFPRVWKIFSKVNFLKEYLPKLSFSKVQFKKAYFPKAYFSKCIGPKHVYCKAYLDVPHLLSFCKLVFESQRKPTLLGPNVHKGRCDFIFSYNTAEPSDQSHVRVLLEIISCLELLSQRRRDISKLSFCKRALKIHSPVSFWTQRKLYYYYTRMWI